MQDGCLELYQDTPADEIPDVVRYIGRDLGRIYFTDAMSLDIFEEIGKYTGDVLILHGDKDTLVDISYSEKAVEVYPSAALSVYEGAAHGFFAENGEHAREEMLTFFVNHLQKTEDEIESDQDETDLQEFTNWTEIITKGVFDQPVIWEQLPEGYSTYVNEHQGTVLRMHYTTDAYDDGNTYE